MEEHLLMVPHGFTLPLPHVDLAQTYSEAFTIEDIFAYDMVAKANQTNCCLRDRWHLYKVRCI